MDSLDLFRAFHEAARRHSFSGAARALNLSPANVSKCVAQLEARYGVRLFNRSTRQVSLTDAGQLLYERSGALIELIELTQSALLDRAARPSGRLNLTAPHGLMQTALPRLLGQFMQRCPDVELHMHVSNRKVDMVEDGIDIAFRVGVIEESSLIVRRLARFELLVAAAPGYWQAHGRPAHPRELLAHRTLAVAARGETPRWRFVIDGEALELALHPVFQATDAAPLVPLALQGMGVIRGSRLLLGEPIASGALEPLFEQYSPHDIWLHAAYTHRRHHSAALRALLAFLEDTLRQGDGAGFAAAA